ncbi:MAG: type I 3-dehydroquinate dehydratase [Desulfurivibrio sp.]|nr:type I 3-dehydroquinate dehydratase [Desulfurivibrio sp.]
MTQPTPPAYRLCVSLAQPGLDELLSAAAQAAPLADVLEIRLDALAAEAATTAVQRLTTELATPLLFTNRPRWEGGACDAAEERRLAVLLAALEAGAAYVDIELRAGAQAHRQLLAAARQCRATASDPAAGRKVAATAAGPGQIIVSWHDFNTTPESAELAEIVRRQQASGATIGKLVTMAHSPRQVRRLLNLLELAEDLDFPLIAFCMGAAGQISRLATCHLGGYMTYAAAGGGQATAPGQLPAARLRQIEQLLTASAG